MDKALGSTYDDGDGSDHEEMDQIMYIPALSNLYNAHKRDPQYVMFGSSQTREISLSMNGTLDISTCLNKQLQFQTNFSTGSSVDGCVLFEADLVFYLISGSDNQSVNFGSVKNKVALAQNALHRAMKTLIIKLNNTNVSANPSDYVNAIAKYQDDEDWRSFYPLSQPDSFNSHDVNLLMTGPNGNYNGPLNSNYSQSRGSFLPYKVEVIRAAASGVKQIVKVTYRVTEPLQHPLLVRSDNSYTSLHRLKNLNVEITIPDLRACFSDILIFDDTSGGATECEILYPANSSKTSILTASSIANSALNTRTDWLYMENPKLLLRTYIPAVKIPDVVTLPAEQLQVRNFSVVGADTAGATTQIDTGAIQVNQIPDKIFIFARQSNDITACQIADAWASIESMTLSTDVDSGALTGATQSQLFQMCKRNNLGAQSFQEFSDYQGSVICVDFSKGDIGGYIAGTKGTFTYSLKVTLRNNTYGANKIGIVGSGNVAAGALNINPLRPGGAPAVTSWKLMVIMVMQSDLILDGDTATLISGIESDTLVKLANKASLGGVSSYNPAEVVGRAKGSGFFDTLRKGFSMIGRKIQQSGPVLKEVAKKVAGSVVVPYLNQLAEKAQNSPDKRVAFAGMLSKPLLEFSQQKLDEVDQPRVAAQEQPQPVAEGSGLYRGRLLGAKGARGGGMKLYG